MQALQTTIRSAAENDRMAHKEIRLCKARVAAFAGQPGPALRADRIGRADPMILDFVSVFRVSTELDAAAAVLSRR